MTPRKANVTLEDLLRVKRAERPRVEFWAEFEREMRMKELAAIVEPRPWWAPLIRVGAHLSRHQLPIGAAAILALSFVTVREYRTYEPNPAFRSELTRRGLAAVVVVPVAPVAIAPKMVGAEPVIRREETPRVAAASTEAALQAAIGQHSHTAPVTLEPAPPEQTPSARYIAANLAVLQAADPRIVDDAFGPATRRFEDSAPVRDPLAQISTPGESRRSRLLSTALPAMATAASFSTSGRIARRLSEERLYDSISRVGVRGDRVAFKF